MKKLVIATTNAHKCRELLTLLDGFPIQIDSLKRYSKVPNVIEDGTTFRDNAVKKAKEFSKFLRTSVLADDSGLEVEALDGRPGVFSARFSGAGATDGKNVKKLLRLLKDVPRARRKARFVCVIALARSGKVQKVFEGVCEGRIAFCTHGRGGFGYDPVFIPKNKRKTFADMTPAEKNHLSHRGKALEKARRYLKRTC